MSIPAYEHIGCIASNRLINKEAELKWCFRETPVNDMDSGWRFLSAIDTDEYINEVSNMSVCTWNTMVEIEPAILPLLDMPIGTDLILEHVGNKRRFIQQDDGEEVDIYRYFNHLDKV